MPIVAAREKLTLKERKFMKGLSEGLNKTEAAMQAYDCKNRNTASAIAAETLNKPRIKESYMELMDKIGLTDDYLLKKNRELIEQNVNYGAKVSALRMANELRDKFPARKSHIESVKKSEFDGLDEKDCYNKMNEILDRINKLKQSGEAAR